VPKARTVNAKLTGLRVISSADSTVKAIEKFISLPVLLGFGPGHDIDVNHRNALVAVGRRPLR
jgi:hypothetical protein